MSATPRGIIVVAALLLVGACENGSSGRTIGLDATGTVAGAVLFDRDGSGLPPISRRRAFPCAC
jgi:hypothetical protein